MTKKTMIKKTSISSDACDDAAPLADAYLADAAKRLTEHGDLSHLPDPMPTWKELVDWVACALCPREALDVVERRCKDLWPTLGHRSALVLSTDDHNLLLEVRVLGTWTSLDECRKELRAGICELMYVSGIPSNTRNWAILSMIMDEMNRITDVKARIHLHPQELLADVIYRNRTLKREDWVAYPLSPIIRAFLQRPLLVKPNRRSDRIIPARIAMAHESDRRMPARFSPPAHVQSTKTGQTLIPGFECEWAPSPALPLMLYDLGGGPNNGKGEGAPLALRIFVEGVLAVPQEARDGQMRVIEVSLREFLSWIAIDSPDAVRRQGRYLDQVQRAVDALDDAWIPIYNPVTLHTSVRRVVQVHEIPTGRGALDRSVTVYVDLPPGSENGPVVPSSLRQWGKTNAGAYRLLLNLCYRWYSPGVTRRPVLKSRRGAFWYQSQNPRDYDPIGIQEVRRMAFPNSDARNLSEMNARALKALKDLESAGEIRIVSVDDGMIVMPHIRDRHEDENP